MAKIALLIGVSEYESDSTPLPGVIKDVEAIKKILEDPNIGGFTQVEQLINPGLVEMQKSIEILFANRRRDDLVLLYFSGRGVKDTNDKLFLTNRITCENMLRSTATSASFIQDIMTNSYSKKQVVILDCSYSGAFAKGLDASISGWVVLTSCTSNQNSLEQPESKLSIYTSYLVEGLETGVADRDKNGLVSVDELHEYARGKVQQFAPIMKPQIFAGEEGYKILLTKASIGNPIIRYRKEVEYYAGSGIISPVNRRMLDVLRDSLEIVPEKASEIEVEVLKPYQDYAEKLQQYENKLAGKVQVQYPLDEISTKELQHFQQVWGLSDEDIETVRERVTLKIEEQYEERLKQYEQVFTETTQRNYPYTNEDRNGLKFLQQIWKLRDEDIAVVEAKITTRLDQHYREKLDQYKQAVLETEDLESETTRDQLQRLQKILGLRDEDVAIVESQITLLAEAETEAESQQSHNITYDLRGATVGNLAHFVQSNQTNTQI